MVAAPFHFWAPDVYDGAPLSSTIAFTLLPKIVFFSLFLRWLISISCIYHGYEFSFLIVGICSVIFGIFSAFKQKRLKRFFIYSSIAQIGFIIAALSIQDITSYTYICFFILNYLIAGVLFWTFYTFFLTFQKEQLLFNYIQLSGFFMSNLISLNRASTL